MSEQPLEPGDPGFATGDTVATTGYKDAGDQQDDNGGYEDYFGYNELSRWYLPDGKQYIEYQRMNEGDRTLYQQKTTRDITVLRGTGDAKMKVDPGTDRRELLIASVKGWHMMKKDPKSQQFVPVPFSIGSSGANFEQWLAKANPNLVDDLERAIRKANPWLGSDETVEDIDKEIERLQERREEVLARERGE